MQISHNFIVRANGLLLPYEIPYTNIKPYPINKAFLLSIYNYRNKLSIPFKLLLDFFVCILLRILLVEIINKVTHMLEETTSTKYNLECVIWSS